jgi:hypothetical protein
LGTKQQVATIRSMLIAVFMVFSLLAVTAPAGLGLPDIAENVDTTPPIVVGGDRAYPPYEFIDKDGKYFQKLAALSYGAEEK